jgi:hypothetical protein
MCVALEGPSHFHLMSYRIVIGPVSFITDSWWSNVVWNHNHTVAFTTSKPANYFSFLRKPSSYVLPLVSSNLFAHIGIFWSHYNGLTDSINPDDTRSSHGISMCTGCYWWRTFQTWDSFPQLLKYQDVLSISIQIKAILLYIIITAS